MNSKWLCGACLAGVVLAGAVAATSPHLVAGTKMESAQAESAPVTIFGVPVVTLTRPVVQDKDQPQFVEATIVPSAGMNLLELKALWPGRGEVSVIQSPNISDAKRMLEYGNDEFGDENFKIGGAILLPYPNRIRGQLFSGWQNHHGQDRRQDSSASSELARQ